MYSVFEKLLNDNRTNINAVSKATKIAPAVLYDWKYGRSKPKVDKLKKIADFFGVSLEVFIL